MTLSEIAAQAATSGECELTKFAFGWRRFTMKPIALQPYPAPPQLMLVPIYRSQKDERLSFPTK